MKLRAPSTIFIAILISLKSLAAPLSGAYTIGGNSPSYANFNAAVAALISNGVSGPVVFNVRAGTYTEQINITAVSGVSGTNTVTFQSQTGNRADVTLTYAANGTGNNWVVNLNGANYIIFNQMTLQATGINYSDVVVMNNSASYNKLTNLIITGPVATINNTNQILVNLTEDGSCTGYCAVYGSLLNNDSYGVYNSFGYSCGQSYNYGMVVENDSFNNQYAGAIYEVRCLTGASIEFNNITTNSTDTAYNGIYINIQEDTVCGNKIINCPGTGINFSNCSPFIFNNFVEITGTAVNYGIEFDWDNYCGDFVFVSANTVLVLNTNSQSAAFYLPYPGYTWNFPFNSLTDNTFINRGGGYAINLTNNGSVTFPNPYSQPVTVDYNDYYTTGTYIGIWGTTNCTTFANWQSTLTGCGCGADAHSKNINPAFVSNTDLHLTSDDLRYGTRTPFQGVWGTDIDGQARNANNPDMGADEFMLSAPVALFTANNTTVCPGTQITFTDQSTGSPISWKWTFNGGTPDTSTSQNPVIVFDTTGTFNAKLVVHNSVGGDSITKTGYITVLSLPVAGTTGGNPDTVCPGNTTQLSVSGDTGTIQWQSSINGISFADISGAVSATYNTLALTQTTYYRVEVSNTCSTDSSNISTISIAPLPVAGTISGGPDTVCFGDTAQLSVSGGLGNIQWQSTIYAYSFTNIQGAQSATYNTGAVTLSTYYRVETSNTCGTDSSNIITISVTPAPLVGTILPQADSVCENSVDSLSTSGSLADVFQWQSSVGGNSFTAINGADTTTYATPPLSQTTIFRLIALNGTCADTSAPVTILVNPSPVPVLSVNDSLICPTDSALIQTTISYSSYAWSDGDTAGSTYVTQAGGYWVSVTDAHGCPAVSNHQGIYVYPATHVSFNVRGDTLTSVNAVSYQWLFNDTIIAGATDSIYIANQTGNYAVQVTDSNGCSASSINTPVFISGITGLVNKSKLTIYPNPFTNTIIIKEEPPGVFMESVVLYNVLGEEMLSKEVNNTLLSPLSIDVSLLPQGVYYVLVKANNTNYIKMITKD